MKAKRWFLYVIVVAVALFGFFEAAKKRRRQRSRAEIFLLDRLATRIEHHLDDGGQLPTSWMVLSNSIEWERIVGICEYNHLPMPENDYTLLERPVTNKHYGGLTFLVSSEPSRRYRTPGRWILVAWPKSFASDVPRGRYTNDVVREWLEEDNLPSEIRAQLPE